MTRGKLFFVYRSELPAVRAFAKQRKVCVEVMTGQNPVGLQFSGGVQEMADLGACLYMDTGALANDLRLKLYGQGAGQWI